MTQDYKHPITPPPELVSEWVAEVYGVKRADTGDMKIAIRAAQWGADQELEACCQWLDSYHAIGHSPVVAQLRAARRPKPPSLKQQSIALLDLIQGNEKSWQLEDLDVVRRALEQLND